MKINLSELEAAAAGVLKPETFYENVIEWCDRKTAKDVLALIRVARAAKVYLNPPFGCAVDAWDKLDEALKEIE